MFKLHFFDRPKFGLIQFWRKNAEREMVDSKILATEKRKSIAKQSLGDLELLLEPRSQSNKRLFQFRPCLFRPSHHLSVLVTSSRKKRWMVGKYAYLRRMSLTHTAKSSLLNKNSSWNVSRSVDTRGFCIFWPMRFQIWIEIELNKMHYIVQHFYLRYQKQAFIPAGL